MTTKNLGGRLVKKINPLKAERFDWKQQAHSKLVFLYMRFSTQEQREQNAYSLERQEGLKKLAATNGAKPEFTSEEIAAIKSKPTYPGWYKDGQIIVEERDLIGISGQKGQESRAGFAHLIASIERDLIGAVYAVDVTRLFRDEFLIMPTQFAKLCYDKLVFVITESAVFDMSDDMQRRVFIMQAEYAAQELAMIQSRLGGSRRAKSRSGRYAGDPVPVGYVVLPDQT